MKKYLKSLLMSFMLLIGGLGISSVAVYAGSSSLLPDVNSSYYIKGYCYGVHDTSRKRVYVYNDENCTNRNTNEYIDAKNDECRIISTSGSTDNVRVSYPAGSRRKERWTTIRVFTFADTYSVKYASATIPTYKFSSASYGYGSISKNDEVRVYESRNGYVRVLYPVQGGYKFAWIKSSYADRYLQATRTSGYVTIPEGVYKIVTALNNSFALDVNNYAKFNGGNVEIYPYHGTDNEHWLIISVGNGYYKIIDVNSGKALDVHGGGSASQTNVNIWEDNNTDAQKWRFYDAGNGYYYIVNAAGCYLDVQNGTVSNGNNVWVYTGNSTNAQKWGLGSVKSSANTGVQAGYAPYSGVDYNNIGLNNQRVMALNKAKNMVTIQWTAPVTFPTWCGKNGSYNYAKATDETKSTKFIKGKTYTGVPYSLANHSWDDNTWKNNLSSLTTFRMTGVYYSHRKNTTANGIDCSYFVYTAFNYAVPSYHLKYQTTGSMLNSRDYRKIDLSSMKPGDIFLKSGHVMMYVGRSEGDYAVFEADANDSKCSYNVYSYRTIKRYGCYRFKGFKD